MTAPADIPPLTRESLPDEPVEQFARWFEQAQRDPRVPHPTAVCVSTIDPRGFPDSRMVLLKTFDREGFVFFTNMHSAKARSLLALPRAAMCFYWEGLGRQVRVQGTVTRVGEDEADTYWRSRPRESRIGAWASDQSETMPGPAALARRVRELADALGDRDVPRPPHWSGFRVAPLRMEFWQEAPDRLHDRFVYRRVGQRWEISQLYP